MTYPRPLLVVILASIVAGCGGAAHTTGGGAQPPPDEQEPDAAPPPDNTPPPKMDAAAPVGSANGQKCTSRTQCESGNCIEGVCCDTTSTGTCRACDIAGSVGTCTEVPDNEDPDNECATDMVSTCRRDG